MQYGGKWEQGSGSGSGLYITYVYTGRRGNIVEEIPEHFLMSSDLAPTSLPLPPASVGSPFPPKQREERPRELDMVTSMDGGTIKT